MKKTNTMDDVEILQCYEMSLTTWRSPRLSCDSTIVDRECARVFRHDYWALQSFESWNTTFVYFRGLLPFDRDYEDDREFIRDRFFVDMSYTMAVRHMGPAAFVVRTSDHKKFLVDSRLILASTLLRNAYLDGKLRSEKTGDDNDLFKVPVTAYVMGMFRATCARAFTTEMSTHNWEFDPLKIDSRWETDIFVDSKFARGTLVDDDPQLQVTPIPRFRPEKFVRGLLRLVTGPFASCVNDPIQTLGIFDPYRGSLPVDHDWKVMSPTRLKTYVRNVCAAFAQWMADNGVISVRVYVAKDYLPGLLPPPMPYAEIKSATTTATLGGDVWVDWADRFGDIPFTVFRFALLRYCGYNVGLFRHSVVTQPDVRTAVVVDATQAASALPLVYQHQLPSLLHGVGPMEVTYTRVPLADVWTNECTENVKFAGWTDQPSDVLPDIVERGLGTPRVPFDFVVTDNIKVALQCYDACRYLVGVMTLSDFTRALQAFSGDIWGTDFSPKFCWRSVHPCIRALHSLAVFPRSHYFVYTSRVPIDELTQAAIPVAHSVPQIVDPLIPSCPEDDAG